MEKTDVKKIENINTDRIAHILKTKYKWSTYPLPHPRADTIKKEVVNGKKS